jgi:GTPase SAR1 family protein
MGPSFSDTSLPIRGTRVQIMLWETDSRVLPKALTRIVTKDAAACVFVFDAMDAQSFANIQKWRRYAAGQLATDDAGQLPWLVLANKADLDGSKAELPAVRKICRKEKMALLEVSAKSGELVREAFQELAASCMCEQWARAKNGWRKRSG